MISIESKITRKLLNFFFLHEKEDFYINQLVKQLKVDKRNLVKKLKQLEKEGLFMSEMRGNQKYYWLNKDYPLYQEYKKIIMKSVGLEKKLGDMLKRTVGVKEAYIFGSYA